MVWRELGRYVAGIGKKSQKSRGGKAVRKKQKKVHGGGHFEPRKCRFGGTP